MALTGNACAACVLLKKHETKGLGRALQRAMITGSFAIAATGAYYGLSEKQEEYGRMFLRAVCLPPQRLRFCNCFRLVIVRANWSLISNR